MKGTAIVATTVPVVFSVNNTPNYDLYMPPHSYIDAGKFNSAKELGQYLVYGWEFYVFLFFCVFCVFFCLTQFASYTI